MSVSTWTDQPVLDALRKEFPGWHIAFQRDTWAWEAKRKWSPEWLNGPGGAAILVAHAHEALREMLEQVRLDDELLAARHGGRTS